MHLHLDIDRLHINFVILKSTSTANINPNAFVAEEID